MAEICVTSPSHPASNPRLVRDATALAEAGHAVRVVMPRFDARWAQLEEAVVAGAPWRYCPVDFLFTPAGRRRWLLARLRRRVCHLLVQRRAWEWAAWRALPYGFHELLQEVAAKPADLVIAHQHPALPVAALAARRAGALVAFDAEDLLAECSAEPVHLHELVERRFLPGCAYLSTMSRAAAEHFRDKHRLSTRPLALHNAPRLAERAGIQPPRQRPANRVPSVYWFGQTIGPHSRADQVLRAMPLVPQPFRLALRGHALPHYERRLRELAATLGCADRLEILPVEPPGRMVALAAEHDILLGSQPGAEPFNQKAIGNKVMTGIAAGLAVLFTDTLAHRRLLEDSPGLGECFADEDERDLASVLGRWLADPAGLMRMRCRVWEAGAEQFNWDQESRQLVARVDEVLSAADRSPKSASLPRSLLSAR